MAINIKFDPENNPIKPLLVLANRNGDKIGVVNTENEHFKDTLNSYAELSFSVSKTDNTKHIWDELVDFRLLWCKEWDEWFEITVKLSEDDSDDESAVKNISAISLCQSELSQTYLYQLNINNEEDWNVENKTDINIDYKPTVFYNPSDPEHSLLNRILYKTPHYKIGHVDNMIDGELVTSLQRTFAFDGKTVYDSILEVCAEVNAIAIFDNGTDADGKISRTINIYDLKTYGNDTSVFVSSENLASNIGYSTDTGSVKNCFRLVAGDDLMTAVVKSINPNGSDYIWYLPAYMKNDMSAELRGILDDYQDDYNSSMEEEYPISATILSKYNALVRKYKAAYERLNPGKTLEEMSSPVHGFANTVGAFYDSSDFYAFLKTVLSPAIISPVGTTAEAVYEDIVSGLTDSNVSLMDVETYTPIAFSPVTEAVRTQAKLLSDYRYKVTVVGTPTYSVTQNPTTLEYTRVWTGKFMVENTTDSDDHYSSDDAGSSVSVSIGGDYEGYLRRKIKTIFSKNASSYNVSALFEEDITEFRNAIESYSLDGLNELMSVAEGMLNVLIEQGVTDGDNAYTKDIYDEIYTPLYEKMGAIKDEIAVREEELNDIDVLVSTMERHITVTQDFLNLEGRLGDSLPEFLSFRREDKYSNENYFSDGLSNAELIKRAQDFLAAAQEEIEKSAEKMHSIESELKNLLVIKAFEPIRESFAVGNWLREEVDKQIYKLRLIDYEIDFENMSRLPVHFAEISTVNSETTEIKSILAQASSMASTYGSTIHQAKRGGRSGDTLAGWVEDGIDISEYNFFSDIGTKGIMWTKNGMLFRDYDTETGLYSDEQLKILNTGIYLTNDNWETNKVGIGRIYYQEDGKMKTAYGVNGEVIYGKLLIGERLKIENSDNTLSFTEDGLIVRSAEPDADNGYHVVDINPNGRSLFSIRYERDGYAPWDMFDLGGTYTTISGWRISKEFGITNLPEGTLSLTDQGLTVQLTKRPQYYAGSNHMKSGSDGVSYYYDDYRSKYYFGMFSADHVSESEFGDISWAELSLGSVIHGATTTSSFSIDLNGASGNITCVSLTQTSDEREKEIRPISDKYEDILMALSPIEYKWVKGYDAITHTGFGAQSIEKALADNGINDSGLVIYDDRNDSYSVAYSELHAIEISVIQKLKRRIDSLEEELNYIKGIKG